VLVINCEKGYQASDSTPSRHYTSLSYETRIGPVGLTLSAFYSSFLRFIRGFLVLLAVYAFYSLFICGFHDLFAAFLRFIRGFCVLFVVFAFYLQFSCFTSGLRVLFAIYSRFIRGFCDLFAIFAFYSWFSRFNRYLFAVFAIYSWFYSCYISDLRVLFAIYLVFAILCGFHGLFVLYL
jgi:hypothetical protein